MRRVIAIGAALAVSMLTAGAGAQAGPAAAGIGAVQVAAGLAFPAAFTIAPDEDFDGERFTWPPTSDNPDTGSDHRSLRSRPSPRAGSRGSWVLPCIRTTHADGWCTRTPHGAWAGLFGTRSFG